MATHRLIAALIASASLAGAGCNTLNNLADGGAIACDGDFGASAAAQKLEAFFAASASFAAQATALDAELLRACTSMAADLGVAPGELAATGSQTATQAACERVARQIREDMNAVRAEAGVVVTLGVVPPRCEVSVRAYTECAARCDATYTPGMTDVMCEGGELRGTCSGMCTGRCAVDATAACAGACDGTCAGGCSGTCNGRCEGTCSARAADGSCAGSCTGTCEGTCSAGCSGTCMGRCELNAMAMCAGECRGGCSVAYTEPRCTGRVVPPMVDADCHASCNAQVNAQATCTPARVTVTFTGGLSAMGMMRAARLTAALQNNYGTFLTTAERLVRLSVAGQAMVTAASSVPNAVASLGVSAATCAAQAASATTQAAMRVDVSVSVTVSVSGSVSGG